MTRRRRAALLIGLAIVLGVLAGSDVARRERDLRRAVGPLVPVVVASRGLAAGRAIAADDLAVRRVPERYAPRERIADPHEAAGLRPRVKVPEGADVTRSGVESAGDGPQLRPGERIADLVVTGDVRLVHPGGRVDLLVTRGEQSAGGRTRLALENAEVITARPAPAAEGADSSGGRIAIALRVTVKQAVYLAAAQNFASELRVLPRGPGDDRQGAAGATASSSLSGVR